MFYRFISFSIITLIACCIALDCVSQTGDIPPKLEALPPTPQAASLGKFGDIPVGYQTGMPNISLPISAFTLNEFNYPVTLNYHSMGSKVDEVATNTGLGWTLFATGSISRSTKGASEESVPPDNWAVAPVGAQNPCDYIYQSTTYNEAKYYLEAQFNWESGLYNFNFAGLSGRFFIRPDWETTIVDNGQTFTAKEGVLIPYQNLKIYILTNRMLAIDENGNKYYLSSYETSMMTTMCFGSSESGVVFPTENKSYFLSQIVTSNNQTLDFSYSTETYSYLHSRYQSMLRAAQSNNNCDDAVPVNSLKECHNTMIVADGLRLQSITASNGQRMEFFYSARKDIYGASKLDKVSFFDNSGIQPIKETFFYYSYFGGQPSNVESNDEINLKLRLDSFRDSYNGNLSEPYTFQYYAGSITPRVFSKQDYFGYAIDGTVINQGFSTFPSQPDIAYSGINRTPDETGSTFGVLQKIVYPTKGFSEFQYELEGKGGIRLKYLINKDYTNEVITKKRYTYNSISQADLSGWSRFKSPTSIFYPAANPDLESTNAANICLFWSLSSSGQSTDYFGERRLYTYVEEIIEADNGTAGGKTSYKYGPVYTALPSSYFYNLTSETYLADQSFLTDPLAEKTVWSFASQTSTWTPKHKIEFQYEISGEYEFRLKQFRLEQTEPEHLYVDGSTHQAFCQPATFNYARFQYISTWYRLKNTIETTYDESGSPSLIKESVNTAFNDNNLKEKRVTSHSSDGDQIEVEYLYPSDFSSLSTYSDMVSKRIIAPVVAQRMKINSLTEAETVVPYSFANGIFKPSGYFSFAPASPADKINTPVVTNPASLNANSNYYAKAFGVIYDALGNIIQYTKSDGTTINLVWGYNSQFIVARKEDSKVRDFFVTGFEDTGSVPTNPVEPRTGSKVLSGGNYTIPFQPVIPSDYVMSYWFYHNGAWHFSGVLPFASTISVTASFLDEVKVYPLGALLTTYEYKYGIGISSMTDQNDRITSYSYDSFNRLEFIKDDKGNVLKRVDYQYKSSN